ncbi:Octamer-binding transcription factor [Trema orientale]|uniref:Octamer-binding transcription factor n=1 Tax=Trema orientale TaxID=63057 RepID=A0A2P5CI27_TREOI|nr:Octamer-binding transcription factor [Trema orientale]
MEAVSEEENQNKIDNSNTNNGNNKINSSNEGQSKPKRQMKTPFQLETLEKAYALEAYPSESIRAELSEKLGLSDRQLQMWFCHRRLKDKKEGGPAKKQRKMVAVLPESPIDELRAGAEPGSDYGSGSGSGSSPFGPAAELRNVVSRSSLGDDMPPMGRRYYERHSKMELRAIAIVEAQLGEPLRDDGPVLGIEFDSLPPDAFGAPIVAEQKRSGHRFDGKSYDRHDAKSNKATPRALHEYPFLPDPSITRNDLYGQVAHNSAIDGSTVRSPSFAVGNEQLPRSQGHVSRVRHSSGQDKQGVAFPSPSIDDTSLPQKDSFTNIRVNPPISEHPIISPENPYMLPDGQIFPNDSTLRMERKRKNEEARIAKEVEAHEMRIRKELEKQENLRRKHEERLRKEMERQDRERRKEEERLMREKQREEERSKREQRREMERREKFLQKESLRAEKKKQKEELRKEREAVRRKVALEKATARRIARESMELIEDEQLELMEMAAARKGLSSIISLDHDTLQSLESLRDFLVAFPPKSVRLKRPFAIQPWTNSEKNIGNLLMVWRFLITFADVLGLWPFTLDEFVQAFHDYDSRLLGEIHVALLKLIIKDIEDVARTPSSGLGMNQNGAANPGGGHPEIVEGAYTWGFDIRNWQRHLNPLTWPEIFRQLALSAGFGPQLKKRSIAWSYLPDNDEGKSCQDVISTLRSGSAAENAFAIMQEKGLLLPRRSRHRLTPGTVKFAAFHVLSLEGSKGLTVLELADKIQKSGLRDLTTSRTPEASISVALTRDAKLFERIAPSTYRVRAAYRKDPADAEAILSAARKKVQVFENGFLAVEDADEVERDEDSECDDVDEDPEVDDLATPSSANIVTEDYNDLNTCSGSGKENLCNDVALNLQNEFDKDSLSVPLSSSKDAKCLSATPERFVASENTRASTSDEENMEIDESKSGESWIHGLTEGEYSDLSVEERIDALVALIGVANEGNSIRVVLEDRLEAANALKKQMWAEAQLEKGRFKEENIVKLDFPPLVGGKTEMHLARSAAEGSQSPLPDIDNKNTDISPNVAENQKPVYDLNIVHNDLNSLPAEKTSVAQDFSTGPDNFLSQQLAFASKRSRSQLKSYIAHRAEEMYVYRSLPLGQDRRRNRYWQFVASTSSNDPGSGRIFVELQDGNWRLIDTEEAFDALLMSLDTRGIRESHLRLMLQKIETSFKENVRRSMKYSSITGRGVTVVKCETDGMKYSPDFPASFDSPGSIVSGVNSDPDMVETSSSFRIELGRSETEKKAALRRYQDFQKWMWKECFNSSALRAMKYGKKRAAQLLDTCDFCLSSYYFEDSHCVSCHQTFHATGNDLEFSQHIIQCKEKRKSDPGNIHVLDSSLPLGSRLLKALLAVIEISVPSEALQSFWTLDHRMTWGVKLNASLSSEQLLQILTLFESVMKRDFLLSNFASTDELLGSCNQSDNRLRDYSGPGSVSILPWIPLTSSAVALRLYEFDASITYLPEEKPEPTDDKEFGEYMKLPTRFAPQRNDKEIEVTELDYNEHMREENRSQKSVRNSYKRGRGGREQGRGKKLHKRANGSKPAAARRNSRVSDNVHQGLRQPGGKILKQGGGRGRRTVRKRRPGNKVVKDMVQVHMADTHSSPESEGESPRNFGEEWDDEKVDMDHMKDDDNIIGEEAVESDDNAQEEEYEQGNWEVGYNGVSSEWNGGLMEVSDDDADAFEDDDNGVEEVGEEDSEGDVDLSEGSDEMPNRIENDEGSDLSASEDYSD